MSKLNAEKIYNYIKNGTFLIDEVVENYKNYVNTIIVNSYRNLSKEDIEEITLDVFLTVWNNKDKLDINKNMSPYIAGITNNLIKKKIRKRNLNFNIEDYEDKIMSDSDIELDYMQSETNKIIIKELENFKELDKEIFLSYYYDFRKIKEISKIFNISESKVKSKLFRIRRKLKKLLKEGGYDFNE